MSKQAPRRVRMMLKPEALDALAEPLGLTTITQLAEFVNIDRPVFHRIYRRQRGAGFPKVHRIISAPWLTPVTIDDLFEEEVPAA